MTNDVAERLAVDPRRVYLAGMSGGARVALGIALASKDIAGRDRLEAPDIPTTASEKRCRFRCSPRPARMTSIICEMRRLDRELSTTHRLVIFTGGHVWLSSDLALQAVEWMELQAMKAGLKPRDNARDRSDCLRRASRLSI